MTGCIGASFPLLSHLDHVCADGDGRFETCPKKRTSRSRTTYTGMGLSSSDLRPIPPDRSCANAAHVQSTIALARYSQCRSRPNAFPGRVPPRDPDVHQPALVVPDRVHARAAAWDDVDERRVVREAVERAVLEFIDQKLVHGLHEWGVGSRLRRGWTCLGCRCGRGPASSRSRSLRLASAAECDRPQVVPRPCSCRRASTCRLLDGAPHTAPTPGPGSVAIRSKSQIAIPRAARKLPDALVAERLELRPRLEGQGSDVQANEVAVSGDDAVPAQDAQRHRAVALLHPEKLRLVETLEVASWRTVAVPPASGSERIRSGW